jgi:ppGpp synthetase/RelA/SpoT-type nucleotidyltranferase
MMSADTKEFDIWFNDLINYYKKNFNLKIDNIEEFLENGKILLNLYTKRKSDIEDFGKKVLKRFQSEKKLSHKIHSYGFRLKDEIHLAEKIIRKKIENPHINITSENFFSEITDLAGLRILQIYKTDIKDIHSFICNCQDWELSKPPVAYNFSPRFLRIFRELNMEVKTKSTGYSSAHYVINHPEFKNCHCEIQVRTLFEEGWSEIDHTFNYPVGKPGKICQSLLETLKRVCDVAVYISDQIPDLYEEEKRIKNAEELEYEMSILQCTLIRNLQSELDKLKDKIKPGNDDIISPMFW